MARARISREKGLFGWLGRIFLEKKACLDGWGAYFSRKRLVWMAGARISREKGLSGWLGRVFLEKKACLDGWGAYFSRKRLASMAGVRISREKGLVLRVEGPLGNPGNQSRIFIHGFRLQFLRKSCHFGQLVWGGPSGPPKARIQRNLAQSAQPIWIPAFSSGNTQSLSAYPCFLREIRKVYLRTLVSPEKSGPVYLRTHVFL